MKSHSYKDYIAPTLVLFLICFVATFALAGTYQVTKPVIDRITKLNADAARSEVLTTGKDGGFTEMQVPMEDGITEVYKAKNNSGIVCTAVVKGFSSGLTVMTGIDADGKVTGIKITSHQETPGLGTKAMTPEHLGLFHGAAAITMTNEDGKTQVDAVTGATYSSKGIFKAVNLSLKEFAKIGGVQ